MTTHLNNTSSTQTLDTPTLLRVLGQAAVRVADGEEVTTDWLIAQFDGATLPGSGSQSAQVGPLLTVPEASLKLRISRWSIYDLIHKKQLLSVKIGRRRFVPSSELTRYLNSLPLRGGQLL